MPYERFNVWKGQDIYLEFIRMHTLFFIYFGNVFNLTAREGNIQMIKKTRSICILRLALYTKLALLTTPKVGNVFHFETFYNTLLRIEFYTKNEGLVSSADDFNSLLQLVRY